LWENTLQQLTTYAQVCNTKLTSVGPQMKLKGSSSQQKALMAQIKEIGLASTGTALGESEVHGIG
jgi:hypothetical protein